MNLQEQVRTHVFFSKVYFDILWKLIKKPHDYPRDIEEMIHLAHSSFWHWRHNPRAKPEDISRAYWLLSRTYAIAEDGKNSLFYAKRALDVAIKRELGPYHLAYAYEAMARASFKVNQIEKKDEYLEKSKELCEFIEDVYEKDILLANLISVDI